jgi:1-deoxy-D-xylulose-5-phosphate reductoisomerase
LPTERWKRSLPVVMNAANEAAVAAFLEGRLGFTDIPRVIAETMDAHVAEPVESLEGVRRIDAWAQAHAAQLVAARAPVAAPSRHGQPAP